ncbi:MAG: hypothetical protein WD845_03255 [Pirellulales bacterium]
MVSISIDWKAALVGACVAIVSVVTVSLAAANVSDPRANASAPSAAASSSVALASQQPEESLLPPISVDTLQALAVAVFVAASAASPIWLIATAHHPHTRSRCTR